MTAFLERFLKRGAVPPAALSGMTYANYEAARLHRIGFDFNEETASMGHRPSETVIGPPPKRRAPDVWFMTCPYCGGIIERGRRTCDHCGAPNRAAAEPEPRIVGHMLALRRDFYESEIPVDPRFFE